MKISEKLAKLIDIKSIVTLLLTLVFCILCLLGRINADQFMTVFAVVVAFYFGTQKAKNEAAISTTASIKETANMEA